jgi:hypothetical protein
MGRVALVAVGLALAAADPAAAAEVRVVTVPPAGPDSPTQAYVELHGAPGETNVVTVTGGPDAVLVRDTGGPLRAGGGCRAVGQHEAACRSRYEYFGTRLHGEDGDDVLVDASFHGVVMHGGPGDDVLTGDGDRQMQYGGEGADLLSAGPGDDFLDGGPGADELRGDDGDDRLVGDPPGRDAWPDILDGGPGAYDLVDYEGRDTGVTIDLASAAPSGAPGEGDVLSGFENAYGGSGPDVIRGTDGPNRLYAVTPFPTRPFDPAPPFAAGDVIDGRGGDDTLEGGWGNDRLEGGPGDDWLTGGLGLDTYRGGTGNDALSLGMIPPWDPRDMVRVRLACGPGRDEAALPDATALIPPDCEQIHFEVLNVQVKHAGPRRLVLRLSDDDGRKIGFCRVTVLLTRPGTRRPFAHRAFRIGDRRRYTAALRWRRTAPSPAVVHIRASFGCKPRLGYRIGRFRLMLRA